MSSGTDRSQAVAGASANSGAEKRMHANATSNTDVVKGLPSPTPFADMHLEKLIGIPLPRSAQSVSSTASGPVSTSAKSSDQERGVTNTSVATVLQKLSATTTGRLAQSSRSGAATHPTESGWALRAGSSGPSAGTRHKDSTPRVVHNQSLGYAGAQVVSHPAAGRKAIEPSPGGISTVIQQVRASHQVPRIRPWRDSDQSPTNTTSVQNASPRATTTVSSQERQEELLIQLNSTLDKMLEGWRLAKMKLAAKKRERLQESRKLIRKYQEMLFREGAKGPITPEQAKTIAAQVLDPETVLQLAMEPTPQERKEEILYQVIDQIEDGLGELKVWSTALDEITSRSTLCPSRALAALLKRIGEAYAKQHDLIENLLVSVRKRLKTDWLHSALKEKQNESAQAMRSRLRALQSELDQEAQRSNELEGQLNECRETLGLVLDAGAAADAMEDLRIAHAQGQEISRSDSNLVKSALVSASPYVPIEVWRPDTKTLHLIKPEESMRDYVSMVEDPASKQGLDASLKLTGQAPTEGEYDQDQDDAGGSVFMTQPDYRPPSQRRPSNQTDRSITRPSGSGVSPLGLTSSAEDRYRAALSMLGNPPLEIMPLVSGARVSDSVRLDSKYFRFRFDPDDEGVFIKLTQAASSEPQVDYLELTIQVREPPTLDSYLHKFSTYNGEAATIELSANQLAVGDVFLRVTGRGTRYKTFGLEFRIRTGILDASDPLRRLLADMTTQGKWQGVLVEKMSILDGLSHIAAKGDLTTSTMRVDRGCSATNPPILPPDLVVTLAPTSASTSTSITAADPAQNTGSSDDSSSATKSIDTGVPGFLGEFAPLFTYGPPDVRTLRLLPQKAVMRIVLQFYDEKLVYDSENKQSRRIPFAHFVYNYFKSRFGLVKLAEVHLCEILESIRSHYSQTLRLQTFARFCGVFSPAYPSKNFDTYMEVYKTLKWRLSQAKRMAQIELDNGAVLILFSAACEAIKDIFRSQPPTVIAGHLKRLEKKIVRHNPRRVDLDETLELCLELSRRDMCVSSTRLKALFQMGDVCGNGFLTPDQFVGVMRSFCPWFEDIEIYIILYEGLVLSNALDSLRLSYTGFLMVGNDYPMSSYPQPNPGYEESMRSEPHLTKNDVPLPVSLQVQEQLVRLRRAMRKQPNQGRPDEIDVTSTTDLDGTSSGSRPPIAVADHDADEDQSWSREEWARSSAEAFVQTWNSLKPIFESQLEYLTQSYCAEVPKLEQMTRDLDVYAKLPLGEEVLLGWTLFRQCAKAVNDAIMTRPLNTVTPVQESQEFKESMQQLRGLGHDGMASIGQALGLSGLDASTQSAQDAGSDLDATERFQLAYRKAVQKREARVRRVMETLSLGEPFVSPDPDREPGATSISDPVYRL